MKFYSPNFENMSTLPVRYTADSEDICPNFEIREIPESSASLAVVCHDPDATRGIPWVHWVVWGLPTRDQSLNYQALPDGAVSGVNSFGFRGYGGPSPGPGTGPHRYVFTLYALSEAPNLEGKTSYAEIRSILDPLCIESSSWTGLYERK